MGYRVLFNNGDPYTEPEKAELWIGHSRGADRLRFAKNGTYKLYFGSSHPDAINHPFDNSGGNEIDENEIPNKFHYEFTEEMKEAILNITKKLKKEL